jgi:hypothetical protein
MGWFCNCAYLQRVAAELNKLSPCNFLDYSQTEIVLGFQNDIFILPCNFRFHSN